MGLAAMKLFLRVLLVLVICSCLLMAFGQLRWLMEILPTFLAAPNALTQTLLVRQLLALLLSLTVTALCFLGLKMTSRIGETEVQRRRRKDAKEMKKVLRSK